MHFRFPGFGVLAMLLVAGFTSGGAAAQDRPVLDILNVESSVVSEVTPDLAMVTLSVVREGSDTTALSQEVEAVLAKALAEAKLAPGVQAATGGFTTSPHLDAKGQRVSWLIRADLILKSKEFTALSRLVGKLSSGSNALQITASDFEVSTDLKQSEESSLIERGIAAFKAKAQAATKALGYASYAIREITLGEVTSAGGPRPLLMDKLATLGTSGLPLEASRITLQLRVQGSVQMRR
jgi:predicted secreted protein